MIRNRAFIAYLGLLLAGAPALAAPVKAKAAAPSGAPAAPESSLNPEVFAPKAMLEELLVKRYAQEMSTRVDRALFNLGAQLDLVEKPHSDWDDADPADPADFPADLSLGTLSPEEVLKRYASADIVASTRAFLRNYRVRGVTVSVGLKPELGDATKKQVEEWLNARLSAEFGKIGKGVVSFIRLPLEGEAASAPKTFLERLGQFQDLAGKLVLALAALIGVLLWRSRMPQAGEPASRANADAGAGAPSDHSAAGAESGLARESGTHGGSAHAALGPNGATLPPGEASGVPANDPASQARRLGRRIVELVPQASAELERVTRSWCRAGEEGRFKLACFAESLGKNLVKLPIPGDVVIELSKAFARMPALSAEEKRGYLEKVYWDLMALVSLGAEALEPPFSYVGALDLGMINQMLVDQNPKMKTLVAVHMSDGARAEYFKSLGEDAKRELLASAAELTSVPSVEFKSIDGSLRKKLEAGLGASVVALDSPVSKLIAALTPLEELKLIGEMDDASAGRLLKSVPSLSFVPSWPDSSLSTLLSRSTPEETMALVRAMPALKDRIISLSPRVTAEVLTDDLTRPDNLSDSQKNDLLVALRGKVKELVEREELKLEDLKQDEPEQQAA